MNKQVQSQGYYDHTAEELEYGEKVAWRNRCIGRVFWDHLTVIDKRHINTKEEIA
ncbi:nitric oxide synthase oxygenase [Neobacillus ginsengisoli]|uniref:nitric oxide synthase oxygenase n=1 Tax=Neobacillus ginsengisoli TaxID=904295 RepID=UPI0027D79779|nr:nitric oxide synthase oxygenase [Neobacillus ginsengisoli]